MIELVLKQRADGNERRVKTKEGTTRDEALEAAEYYVYEVGYVYAAVVVDGEIYAEYEI